jgi:hypothetical protein
MTEQESRSLGDNEYRRLVAEADFFIGDEYEDDGQNHYFDAIKTRTTASPQADK